jgi:hypothetical protein
MLLARIYLRYRSTQPVWRANTGSSQSRPRLFPTFPGSAPSNRAHHFAILAPTAGCSGGKVYIANFGDSSVVEVPAGCNATKSCTSQTRLQKNYHGIVCKLSLFVELAVIQAAK